ncbi:MAG: class I SAM-dependent methyltransferase [Candidatus Omnitrophica bacterium]|nr:class I SAM-dependent methyltransferase [Candidatus Omnitrophota bacterium]
MKIVLFFKRLFFPGLDLHTRCRYRFLPRYFRTGPIYTLDAGCGNGALPYAAYKRGNFVLGITKNPEEVRKASALFSAQCVDSRRLHFKVLDLYDLSELGHRFDQIICSETLEHIKRDDIIIKHFYDLLRPGGMLHLCCPYAKHPAHHINRIDQPENGGHVRDGYTLDAYKSLLEPIGFKIIHSTGLGSPLLVYLDNIIRWIRNTRGGDIAALLPFLLTLPLQRLDFPDPPVPFSLYVQAIK